MTNNLTSKLQYKNYEKGEFSNEESRSLQETLELIKSFPWDKQRGVDVQLTGPGIAIEGTAGDHLKMGIYFNNKFALYYLDNQNHLFEFHTDNIDTVCEKAIQFFNMSLELSEFEKHFLSKGAKMHFESRSYWYTINRSREKLRLTAAGIYLTLCSILFVIVAIKSEIWLFGILMFSIMLILFYGLFIQIKIYRWSKNMKLWFAQGDDHIVFNDGNGQQSYFKSTITTLNVYGRPAGRGRVVTAIMELKFADGQTIKFPSMLIDAMVVINRLRSRATINYLEQNTWFRKSVWQF